MPALVAAVMEATQAVKDPATGKSVYERWKEKGSSKNIRSYAVAGSSASPVPYGILGGGSDFMVFLQHDGVPSLDMIFDGPYGVYHSVYDDYRWMARHGDPGFRYHALMSQFWGVLALRLANADVLPFDFAFYGRDIGTFVKELCGQGAVKAPASGATTGVCRAGEVDLGPAVAAAAEFASAGRDLKQAVESALAAAVPGLAEGFGKLGVGRDGACETVEPPGLEHPSACGGKVKVEHPGQEEEQGVALRAQQCDRDHAAGQHLRDHRARAGPLGRQFEIGQRPVRAAAVQAGGRHAQDVQLVRIAQQPEEEECGRVGYRAQPRLVVKADRQQNAAAERRRANFSAECMCLSIKVNALSSRIPSF